MRPGLIEMANVFGAHCELMGLAQDGDVVETFTAHAAEERWQVAFMSGVRTAVRMTSVLLPFSARISGRCVSRLSSAFGCGRSCPL